MTVTSSNFQQLSRPVSTVWKQHEDPKSGASFYFNSQTQRSQWEKPDCFLERPVSPPTPQSPLNTKCLQATTFVSRRYSIRGSSHCPQRHRRRHSTAGFTFTPRRFSIRDPKQVSDPASKSKHGRSHSISNVSLKGGVWVFS